MSNTKVRYPAVEQFIDNNKDALVRSVQEIVRFPSVEAPAATFDILYKFPNQEV